MRYWQCKADQSTEFRLYRGKELHLPKGDMRKTRFFVLESREFIHVRLHITEKVKQDVHYAVAVNDIKEYEKKYGNIPDGAFVALRTDWSKKWPNMEAVSGTDADGKDNFPGWSLEALQYIYEERNAAANGHETLDTDASVIAEAAGDLICERYVLGKGKIQVEMLANLDQVAVAGAVVIVSYPRFEGATGLPARVWAITE
ncbi:MAG: cyclase family protein [Clostridiales bacterium]|nr:cyclase family protein [Clostridiales bacterium]